MNVNELGIEVSTGCNLKGIVHPKSEISVFYSPLCRSKPV